MFNLPDISFLVLHGISEAIARDRLTAPQRSCRGRVRHYQVDFGSSGGKRVAGTSLRGLWSCYIHSTRFPPETAEHAFAKWIADPSRFLWGAVKRG